MDSNYLQKYSEQKKSNYQHNAYVKFKKCHMNNNTVKDRSVYPHKNSDGHNYRDKLPHQAPV